MRLRRICAPLAPGLVGVVSLLLLLDSRSPFVGGGEFAGDDVAVDVTDDANESSVESEPGEYDDDVVDTEDEEVDAELAIRCCATLFRLAVKNGRAAP